MPKTITACTDCGSTRTDLVRDNSDMVCKLCRDDRVLDYFKGLTSWAEEDESELVRRFA